MKTKKILLGFFIAGSLAAQTVLIEGPVSGFIFDQSTGALRPIVGLPGAAYLGDPVITELSWAGVAPGGRWALALRDGALIAVTGLRGPEPTWSPIESVQLTPDRAVWSEDGSVALIYSTATGAAQRIRGLTGMPVADEAVRLPGARALAVDAEGRIIAGMPEGVLLLGQDGASPLLPGLQAVAIAVTGANLLVAGSNGEVWWIRNYAGEASAELLTSVEDPVGVALSPDQRQALIASRAERAVLIYELAARAPMARLVADPEPSTLDRLSERDLWLIRPSFGPSDPLLVLKTSPEAGIWFVPARKGE